MPRASNSVDVRQRRGDVRVRAAEWDQRYREADSLWSSTPNLFVENRLAPHQPGKGVDLACGEGRNAIWLAKRGWSMTAVDFSTVAVDRGRQRSTAVDFVVADVMDWEPGFSVDLLLVSYLHLAEEDLRSLFVRARGWLSDGGEMFLIGHDRSNIERGYGGPPDPEILWDVGTIVGWLDGLEVIEAQVVHRPVDDEGEVRIARDALVRVRARQGRTEPS